MLISAAMSAAGSVAGGIQANNQAKAEAIVAKQNAGLARNQAEDAELAGKKERKDYWRDVAQRKGQNIAAAAANGIDVGFGSGARMQEDAALIASEDADALYKNQANRTRGFVIEASNYKNEAKAAKARGKAALIGGLIQGASTLIGGASQYKGQRAKLGQKGWF